MPSGLTITITQIITDTNLFYGQSTFKNFLIILSQSLQHSTQTSLTALSFADGKMKLSEDKYFPKVMKMGRDPFSLSPRELQSPGSYLINNPELLPSTRDLWISFSQIAGYLLGKARYIRDEFFG